MIAENIITFFIITGGVFLLFLVIREYVCWYFKINKVKKTLEEINDSLKKIANCKNIEKEENKEKE